ncbi:hypothetical protein Syun_014048 [Stephania yunnanensis]|uniref:Mesoderm development candidate 2 n=1 Tax=Stephania yunnanensis TaxID=152371 RepID=A0AAP0JK97_9MAGN
MRRSNSAIIISSSSLLSLLFLLDLILSPNLAIGSKRRVHVPDELDDVIDDEEDEVWKQWGMKSKPSHDSFDPPPLDLLESNPYAFEAEMLKRHSGPSIGFVKLQPGVRRSSDKVVEIARKWSKLLKTGSVNARFTGFDPNTVMYTMESGQDITELKEFVLSQPEAYEIKIGEQIYRRPGDPPLDEFIEKLRSEHKADDQVSKEETGYLKDEL